MEAPRLSSECGKRGRASGAGGRWRNGASASTPRAEGQVTQIETLSLMEAGVGR